MSTFESMWQIDDAQEIVMSFLTTRDITNTRAASHVVCHDVPRNRRPFDRLIRFVEAVARREFP